jgi:hypothetical protein
MRRPLLLAIFAGLLLTSSAFAQKEHKDKNRHTNGKLFLWQDPGDIKSKNLLLGAGGGDKAQPPLTFDKEDMEGHSPKFDAKDATGVKWKVKLGPEAQTEPVASRLLWAMGYFANENYFEHDLAVQGLPRLKRGNNFESTVNGETRVQDARLQVHQLGKKDGDWSWKKNPFLNTREFNGLRVMMALMRNWDLKDDNNAVYIAKDGTQLYEVTDVGSTFGMTGRSYTDAMSKNDLPRYQRAKFITKVKPDYVDFNFPTHAPLLFIFAPSFFLHVLTNHWVGKHIPREDAKWIGGLLGQLTHEQICDAFRAGGYKPEEVEGFARILEARIADLNRL